MNKDVFKVITDYPVAEYRCGARAGNQVRLKHDIVIKDSRGRRTGEIYSKDEIWTVLCGAAEGLVVIWLRQADGQTCTWDDGDVFLKTFEIIKNPSI